MPTVPALLPTWISLAAECFQKVKFEKAAISTQEKRRDYSAFETA
jgi:hypothetical protein